MIQVATRALAAFVAVALPAGAAAQDEARVFAGGLVGVSALSADARSVTTESDAAISLYDPKNGLALNLFAGVHVADYFSVQANWMWNRNDLILTSSALDAAEGRFYEQRRRSRQHAFVLDGLIYFRRRDSAIRPYLGTGLSLTHFASREIVSLSLHGLAPPGAAITSAKIGLRSHVGIDVRLSRHASFRYSFSETISGNPISAALTPPAPRPLMNFQNLFGFVGRF